MEWYSWEMIKQLKVSRPPEREKTKYFISISISSKLITMTQVIAIGPGLTCAEYGASSLNIIQEPLGFSADIHAHLWQLFIRNHPWYMTHGCIGRNRQSNVHTGIHILTRLRVRDPYPVLEVCTKVGTLPQKALTVTHPSNTLYNK